MTRNNHLKYIPHYTMNFLNNLREAFFGGGVVQYIISKSELEVIGTILVSNSMSNAELTHGKMKIYGHS